MKLNKDFPHKIYLDKRVLVNGIKRNTVNYENNIELSQWIQDLINLGEISINVCGTAIGNGSKDSPLCFDSETQLSVIDSSTIDFSVSGISNHTLTGAVKVSAALDNKLSINGDGLYVPETIIPAQTQLSVTDSSTIDFSVSGINNHTLTGSVLIPGLLSSDTDNQVVLGTDGKLFVPEITLPNVVTADNGLTKIADNIQLGGALIKDTSITGNFDTYFGNKNYIFGDDSSFIGATGVKFVHKLSKTLNNLTQGFSTNFKFSDFTIDTGFSLSGGEGLFNDNNLTRLNVNNTKSISYASKAANQTSYIQFRGVGTPTLSMDTSNGNIGVYGNHMSYTQLDNTTNDAANKATISHFANYHSLITAQNTNHNAITNFYHLFLADTTNNLPTSGYIPNKYGIYQEGLNDNNVFFGDTIFGNSTLIPSAKLAVNSITQGFLLPRLTTTQRDAITTPATGLMIYNITTLSTNTYNGSTWVSGGSSYTFSTGLTNTSNTITNNLLTGVSGGQSVIGGTASGNGLTLSSTSNATKGKITAGTLVIDESTGFAGFGVANPIAKLQVVSSLNTGTMLDLGANNTASILTFAYNSGAVNITSSPYGTLTIATQSSNHIALMPNGTGRVGIGTATPNASAKLEVTSTTQGFLPPRMTASQASAIASPAKSLIIYVTDTNGTFTSAGIWIYTTSWKLILAE